MEYREWSTVGLVQEKSPLNKGLMANPLNNQNVLPTHYLIIKATLLSFQSNENLVCAFT